MCFFSLGKVSNLVTIIKYVYEIFLKLTCRDNAGTIAVEQNNVKSWNILYIPGFFYLLCTTNR